MRWHWPTWRDIATAAVVFGLLYLEEDFVFWMKLGYIFVVALGFDACESVVCGG